jgi:hypothetical protein
MFLFWGVDAARANTDRYERKLDRAELSYIIKNISIRSKQGFTELLWEAPIRHANKRRLKDLGYHILDDYPKYRIVW